MNKRDRNRGKHKRIRDKYLPSVKKIDYHSSVNYLLDLWLATARITSYSDRSTTSSPSCRFHILYIQHIAKSSKKKRKKKIGHTQKNRKRLTRTPLHVILHLSLHKLKSFLLLLLLFVHNAGVKSTHLFILASFVVSNLLIKYIVSHFFFCLHTSKCLSVDIYVL